MCVQSLTMSSSSLALKRGHLHKVTPNLTLSVTLSRAQLRTLHGFVRSSHSVSEGNTQISNAVLVAGAFLLNNEEEGEVPSWCCLWRWADTPRKHSLTNLALGGAYDVNWCIGVIVAVSFIILIDCAVALFVYACKSLGKGNPIYHP